MLVKIILGVLIAAICIAVAPLAITLLFTIACNPIWIILVALLIVLIKKMKKE